VAEVVEARLLRENVIPAQMCKPICDAQAQERWHDLEERFCRPAADYSSQEPIAEIILVNKIAVLDVNPGPKILKLRTVGVDSGGEESFEEMAESKVVVASEVFEPRACVGQLDHLGKDREVTIGDHVRIAKPEAEKVPVDNDGFGLRLYEFKESDQGLLPSWIAWLQVQIANCNPAHISNLGREYFAGGRCKA